MSFLVDRLKGAPDLGSVLSQVGYAERTIRNRFRDHVGLAPKAFHRVMRFQALLRSLANRKAINWAELAAEHGYFDQAHFIHDFRGFTSMTPTEYLARQGPWQNHVAIP